MQEYENEFTRNCHTLGGLKSWPRISCRTSWNNDNSSSKFIFFICQSNIYICINNCTLCFKKRPLFIWL